MPKTIDREEKAREARPPDEEAQPIPQPASQEPEAAPEAFPTTNPTTGQAGLRDLPFWWAGFIKVQAADLDAGIVSGATLTQNAGVRDVTTPLPDTGTVGTIPTTGAPQCVVRAPCAGTLAGVNFAATNTLAAGAGNDTNFITWTITNKGNAGAGTTVMLTTTPAGVNTTKLTGGSNGYPTALAQVALTPVGSPNNVVAAGDRLLVVATITGTLPNTLTGVKVTLLFLPTT